MSVIIRLQNLPWSANSLDIRHYFRGLSIPEGGVHIVGGEMGDAFIAFSTDEDARQAMMLAGGKIKEVQISLMLSSRSEMQKIIEAARQASMSNSLAQLLGPSGVPPPAVVGFNQSLLGKERKDLKGEKKDSSDLGLSNHETGRMDKRDRKDRSRSRSRDRGRKDRKDRDRDRDRDRRRRSRSRSRSRDRRRRRSRSRSRGRDVHSRDRDKKDLKDDLRKDEKMNIGPPTIEPGTNVPNIDILSPSTWNVMQTGALAQNAQLLTNFELLRNLATQKAPLLPGGPATLLPTPLNIENDGNPDIFLNRRNSPSQNEFGNRNKGDGRGGNQRGFKNFEEKHFHDNAFGGDGRFDRNQNQKNFQNFGPGFSMRNGNEAMNNPRFGNFGRGDNGFLSRGPGNNRDRPNMARGLLDLPVGMHQRDRFGNRDDRVDEFGRSIQLRNRKNMANEDGFKDEGPGGMDHQNFQGFQNRFGKNQQNQRPPPLLRGRDNWGAGRGNEGFQDRRGGGFRGSYDESNRGFRSKSRDFSKHHHEDGGEPSGKSSEKDCCVEIRDLPPQIAYGEVRRPFSNLKLIIREIKFFDYTPTDKKCRIKFLNNDNKKKAIQLSNKILIDNKQVHLLHITDGDFDECVDEGVKRPEVKFSDDEDDAELSSRDVYVQVKDLPPDAEETDVVNLFPNTNLERILLEDVADGKKKIAFVKFEKAIDAKVALGTPSRTVNDSIVSVVVLSQYAFNEHLNKTKSDKHEVMEVDPAKPGGSRENENGEEEGKDKESVGDGKKSTCVLMKNLPPEASDRDICDFFSDIGLVPNKIHLMLDMAGQASGDAFCEFSDPLQAEKASTKNSAHLGKNIVNVLAVPRSEMVKTLGLATGASPGKPPNPAESFGRPQCVVALENIPFRAGNFDIISFFGWSYNLTEKDILRRYNEKGQPTGDGKVCFKSPEDALRAIRFLNNRSLMGRVIRMKLV